MKAKVFVWALMVFALLLAAPVGAWADRLDMSKYTCGDMLEEAPDDIVLLVFWVDGYYSGKTDDVVVDSDALVALIEKLADYCSTNKKVKLFDAIKKIAK